MVVVRNIGLNAPMRWFEPSDVSDLGPNSAISCRNAIYGSPQACNRHVLKIRGISHSTTTHSILNDVMVVLMS